MYFCRIFGGLSLLDAVLADFHIAATGAFLLDLIIDFLRDDRLAVAFCGVSLHLAVIRFPLRPILQRVGFEND